MENIEEVSGVPVDVLIMDDDAATLSRVKEALDHEHKTLSTDIIEYYKMCFSYAIQQNKNNETKLKETLTAIVPHSFGNHDKCGNWCNKSIENNFNKYLPHGRPLTDDALRQDVQIIFDTVANNAERLAPAGSTKDVESTNDIYASKAPKRFCFSKSENLKTRPNKSIAPSSSAVTGLTANGNIFFYNGKPVHAVTSEAAFQSFVLWLEQYGQVMLVAHNCKLFDARRLINNMSKLTCYAAFGNCVSGFADTLSLFRQKFPGLNSYSQQKLFEHFCNEQYNAHNAVDDVDSLHKLMTFPK
ncbi:unnamed protein product [Mytilus coruscus]|uniref:Uncharacterized protein n=1 Tax=Mytilus coruscus TaxID=42192 RepID=A0A6J8EPY3_MYTCO|nr:unnamed protein product [Mytilus coruscus]